MIVGYVSETQDYYKIQKAFYALKSSLINPYDGIEILEELAKIGDENLVASLDGNVIELDYRLRILSTIGKEHLEDHLDDIVKIADKFNFVFISK